MNFGAPRQTLTILAAAIALLASGPSAHAAVGKPALKAQTVTLHVFRGESGLKGPDGRNHDAFVPSSFAVTAGQPVHLVVINEDEGPHTISPDNPHAGFGPFLVRPGKQVGNEVQPVTSTFDFTPSHKGAFRWHCEAVCDGGGGHWAMGHAMVAGRKGSAQACGQQDEDGFMAGYIVVQ
ncbi:MAG TPA: hypothetical protein V6D47_13925 [Oscillatoriaceae cyanobacterium]